MLLRNLLPTKKNTRVLVNGTAYFIGEDLGIVDEETKKPRDVPQEDAARLLKNERAWREWDGKAPEKAAPAPKATKPKGMQLLDAGGNAIPKPEDATKPVMDVETKAKDADNAAAMQEAQESFETSKQADESTEESDEGEELDEDPPIPNEGEEWADPEPHYSREWLEACAEAYEVKYRKNISNEKLCEKIKDSMYE